MKNLIVISILLITTLNLIAQKNEGKVKYVEVTKIELPEEAKPFAHLIPSEQKITSELIFSGKMSLFRLLGTGTRNSQSDDGLGDELKVHIISSNPKHEVYRDISTNELIQKRQLLSKEFLIAVASDFIQWKIEHEVKEIKGYTCKKAMATVDDMQIVAWFTSEIPVFSGPRTYGNLPGLILQLDINEGETLITAELIELCSIDEGSLVKPTKGKKISQEKFNILAEEKMKELEEEYGGSRIKIHTLSD